MTPRQPSWERNRNRRVWIVGEEKRRRVRRQTQRLRVTPPIGGKVLDLSPLGMAIEASEGLTIGHNYWFLLRQGWHDIRIDGTVRWCALVETKRKRNGIICPVYRAGIALEAPGPKALRFFKRC